METVGVLSVEGAEEVEGSQETHHECLEEDNVSYSQHTCLDLVGGQEEVEAHASTEDDPLA